MTFRKWAVRLGVVCCGLGASVVGCHDGSQRQPPPGTEVRPYLDITLRVLSAAARDDTNDVVGMTCDSLGTLSVFGKIKVDSALAQGDSLALTPVGLREIGRDTVAAMFQYEGSRGVREELSVTFARRSGKWLVCRVGIPSRM